MSSPPESVASLPQPKVRKRADAKTLLGDDSQDSVKDIPPPPEPSQNDRDYEKENLKARLIYADRTLRNPERKLPPIGIRALKLYNVACARLLDLEEGETFEGGEKGLEAANDEWRAMIRMYERSIYYTACLKMARTSDEQMLQEKLLDLQRTAFYARYGDMFTEACRQLKKEAEIQKVDGWEFLKGYWTEIDTTLQKETEAYKRVPKGEQVHDNCPTHLAVFYACNRVGFNIGDMLPIIHLYAVRNEIVHANFLSLIKNGLYHSLAKRLYDDFCCIPLIIPDSEKTQTTLAMTLLEAIIGLWFNRDPDDLDNFQGWTPTEAVKGYRKSL
jgi:hypothetical protein